MPLSLLHANDKRGEYPNSWYAATAKLVPRFPELTGSHRFDIAIIGGGYSGLSTALHLSQRGYKVAIVEAHRVGWGASGRNGGQVASGQRIDPIEMKETVGKTVAKQAHEIGIQAADLVRTLIREHQIACDYRDGVIEANHKKSFDEHSKKHVEQLKNEFETDTLRFLEPHELSEKLDAKGYFGGILNTASGHLHPLNYALGLATAAEKAGVTIFENSEVLEIKKDNKPSLRTEKGDITADWLVLACNGYLGNLEKSVARAVMPINNFIVATEPLGEDLAAGLIRDREAVADSRFVVNYFRLSDDNRLLFGGGENYGYRFPGDIAAFVRPKMLKIFPQLKGKKIEYGWGGTLAITRYRHPAFKRLPGNIINISGYSGSGVAMATMAGKITAEMIAGQSEKFDIMAKLPTPAFPGGTMLRWPTLVAAMLWFSLQDKI